MRWLYNPVDTGRKLNVHKTFRRRLGRLLNVLCTFSLRPVSAGKEITFTLVENVKKISFFAKKECAVASSTAASDFYQNTSISEF